MISTFAKKKLHLQRHCGSHLEFIYIEIFFQQYLNSLKTLELESFEILDFYLYYICAAEKTEVATKIQIENR